MKLNLYDILCIDKDASFEDIKSSFRTLAKLHHADHNDGEDDGIFADIKKAYDILSDDEKRAKYDLTGYVEIDEVELYHAVYSLLRAKLNEFLTNGNRVFEIDFITIIVDYCSFTIKVHKGQVAGLLKQKEFLIKVNKKFRRKRPSASESIVNKVMLEKIGSIDQDIISHYKQIDVLNCLSKIIDQYEFDFLQFLE